MNISKTIEVLNSLLEINTERTRGYETAANETFEAELKTLFFQFIQTSQSCIEDLTTEIKNLQGDPTPADSINAESKFFKIWADLKSAITGRDRRAILNCCEYGEEYALEIYNDVLSHKVDYLSLEQHKMIYKQYVQLKSDHDKVKVLRDIQLEHN